MCFCLRKKMHRKFFKSNKKPESSQISPLDQLLRLSSIFEIEISSSNGHMSHGCLDGCGIKTGGRIPRWGSLSRREGLALKLTNQPDINASL